MRIVKATHDIGSATLNTEKLKVFFIKKGDLMSTLRFHLV